MSHHITRSLVRGARVSTLRARCSCGGFSHDVAPRSMQARRKLDRLINEHTASTMPGSLADQLDIATRNAFEAPL